MFCTTKKAKITVGALGFLGVTLLLVGIVSLSLMPAMTKKKIHENIVLAEGKETFEKWRTTPIPVFFSVYLFNVTNPFEVEKYGNKPIVEEVGPFVFKQTRSKNVLSWDDDNFTVTYDDIKRFNFLPLLSEDPEVRVYSLNMPLMGISQFLKKKATEFMKKVLVPTFSNLFDGYEEKLFVYRKARELLFEGYKVDMLEDLTGVLKPFLDVPEFLPNNTFGFLYGKNNTGEGRFTVHTGADDITKYAKIVTWDKKSQLEFWNDKYCGMINGTDGAQFSPPVTKYNVLYVFTPEVCRSVYLQYVEDTEVRGIPALRFGTPSRLFANPKENPDNACYCLYPELCDYYGMQDISLCKKGMPLAVSLPHFYMAHEIYNELIDGLDPRKEKHDTYVDIEPTTGIVLRASRKLQINIVLEKSLMFKQTSKLPLSALPLLWIKEEAELDVELADAFKTKVRTPVTVAKSALTACIVLGLLWIVTAGCITIAIVLKKQKHSAIKTQYKTIPQKSEENGKNEYNSEYIKSKTSDKL